MSNPKSVCESQLVTKLRTVSAKLRICYFIKSLCTTSEDDDDYDDKDDNGDGDNGDNGHNDDDDEYDDYYDDYDDDYDEYDDGNDYYDDDDGNDDYDYDYDYDYDGYDDDDYNDDDNDYDDDDYYYYYYDYYYYDKLANVRIKPGVKLPRSTDEWTAANDYFKTVFGNFQMQPTSIDLTIEFMNNTIYNYFANLYGTVNSTNHTNAFCGKYKHLTPKSLKHQLKQLKMNDAHLQEIKYVSQLLRSKLKSQDSTHSSATAVNQDRYVSKNLWGFVKNVIEKGSAVLPSFSRDRCTRFFITFFAAILPYKKFTIPHWIPSFNQPSFSFDQSAPSYDKVIQVVRRIKSSGSPCPLDKISIICFKRCPYLRTFLTEIIRIVWESGRVPSEWKKACTVLVHKKGTTLIDLKNAFGEVHHNLITEVLNHHHVPLSIQTLVSILYENFQTSIITDNFTSPAIPVGRGVLQGDCLSPLLFNICFNTFIQVIKQDKYKQLGFSTHDSTDRLFNPIHWFQFADDAAVVSTDERENQLLLNCFTKWCQWANMIIRVDKRVTFGIKKFSSRSL